MIYFTSHRVLVLSILGLLVGFAGTADANSLVTDGFNGTVTGSNTPGVSVGNPYSGTF
jgi:hypothetical protein